MKYSFSFLFLYATVCWACSGNNSVATDAATSDVRDPDELVASPAQMHLGGRVLLVGNSHTSFSTTGTHLGEIWSALNPDFAIDTIATPGLTLADHAENPRTLLALEEGVRGTGPYDVVVLQEQSARYLQERNYDVSAVQALRASARRGNPCVLVVFSQIQVDELTSNYGAAIERYRETSAWAAENLRGLFAPIGDLFANVRTENRTLYNALLENTSCCGYHAKPLGGYAHALVLDMLLTGRRAEVYDTLRFDASHINSLRDAAQALLADQTRFRQYLALPQRCATQ